MVCWFLSSKIQLLSSSRSIPQTFSPDLLENIFWNVEHIVENEKDGNHLVHGLMNMMDGVEQTSLNPIFFLHDSCWMRPYVIVRSRMFCLFMSAGRFLWRFPYTRCSCWENKTSLSVWLQFKNLNWLILLWSHHMHCITFLPWSSTFGVGCGD